MAVADGGSGGHQAGDGGGAASGGEPGSEPGNGGGESDGGGPPVEIPEGPFTGPDPFPCDSDLDAAPDDLVGVCVPGGAWGTATEVAVAAGADANLVGITPDELTLVWSEAEGSELIHFVADRASPSAKFGTATRLEGVTVLAVSPDGLRLATLSPDQGALVALSRADRSSAFGAEAEGEFAALDADARDKGFSFSSCVFASDDRTLYYTAGTPDSQYLLRVAQREDAGAWAVGTLLEQCELEVHGGYGRYPTGVSADGNALFFYDSWRGVMRAAYRDPKTAKLTWFEDLGQRLGAQPNQACDRIYFSQPGSESAVLSAPAE